MTKHILLPSSPWESTVQTLVPVPAVKRSLPATHKAKRPVHLARGHRDLSSIHCKETSPAGTDMRADVGSNWECLLLCLWQPVNCSKLVDASRWLSVRLAVFSQKAHLHCKSALLQVLLRIYITNDVSPALFVTLGMYVLFPEKEHKVTAFTLFCNTVFITFVNYILTLHMSFVVIYLNKGM